MGLAFGLIVLMAALCSHSALAPGLPFTVFGFVHNDKGAPMYGAYVTVQSPIESKTSTTDSQGRYWVTISINGVGDAIKVTASKDGAQAGASATVPSGSSSLRVDVTIRSAAPTTSTTIPPTTTKASSTTSSRSTTTLHSSGTTVNPTGTSNVSTTNTTEAKPTNGSITTQSNTTAVLTTTITYTTTETSYQLSYQTLAITTTISYQRSVITTTRTETQAQSLSTIVLSVEVGPRLNATANDNESHIAIVSNIQVDDLIYDEDLNQLTMSVEESHGSPAPLEISVPKELIADPADIVVDIDGRSFGFELADRPDAYSLSLLVPPGQSTLSISLGSRISQNYAGMVQEGSSAEGTSPISSVLVGLCVLVILLSLSRRFA